MAYRVEVSSRAEQDLKELSDRITADQSKAAAIWFGGLDDAISSLEQLPRRCPLAIESKRSGRPLRHLLYGAKRDVYRILFEIDESRKIVNIVTIRHAAMDEFIGRT